MLKKMCESDLIMLPDREFEKLKNLTEASIIFVKVLKFTLVNFKHQLKPYFSEPNRLMRKRR